MTISELIRDQSNLASDQLIRAVFGIFGTDTIATSSFGASSGVLIHLVASLGLPIRIVYVNTGFLFPETLAYIGQLQHMFPALTFVEVRPKLDGKQFIRKYGSGITKIDPDFCCLTNKVKPLQEYLFKERVKAWITGVRAGQTTVRTELSPVTQLLNGVYKISPLLGWTAKDVDGYMKKNGVPFHPLYEKGYTSIGCETCTSLPTDGDERSGRWLGSSKKECGLHTDI